MALLDIVVEQYDICQEQSRNTVGVIQDITIISQNQVIEELPEKTGEDYEIGFGY